VSAGYGERTLGVRVVRSGRRLVVKWVAETCEGCPFLSPATRAGRRQVSRSYRRRIPVSFPARERERDAYEREKEGVHGLRGSGVLPDSGTPLPFLQFLFPLFLFWLIA